MLHDLFYLSLLLNFIKSAGVLVILEDEVGSPEVHTFVLVEEPQVLLLLLFSLLNSKSSVLKSACAILLLNWLDVCHLVY